MTLKQFIHKYGKEITSYHHYDGLHWFQTNNTTIAIEFLPAHYEPHIPTTIEELNFIPGNIVAANITNIFNPVYTEYFKGNL